MAKRDEFDPNEILDDVTAVSEDDFDILGDLPELNTEEEADDLDQLLSDEFLASLGIERTEEPLPEEPGEASFSAEDVFAVLGEESEPSLPEESPEAEPIDADVKEYPAKPQPAFDVESELGEEFIKTFEEVAEETGVVTEEPAVPVEPKAEQPVRRRKKLSRERLIKEVYLPPAIAALTLILVLTFIGSSVGRIIRTNKEQQESIKSSQEAASTALDQEAQRLAREAQALADGYNYDEALAMLDTFSGDKSQYQDLMDAYNNISQAKSKIKPIDDPNSIPNLSFHCLIADPARAFIDKDWGKSYNTNYVTIDEFSKILDQLYAGDYVLVDFGSFIVETVGEDGKVTYSTQPIFLPEGKKPIMLTETLVNYETFTIDSDGDGEADKGGDGFASRLVVKDGKIVNEYVDANGNTLYGAYDLVPILEEFIEAHPDFCYRGARATLAVSGEDGVFGYRIMHSVKESKGEDYYNQQVEGAKTIAAALREAGYTIACYTYANVSYGTLSATKIQVDMDNWKKEVKPVLGDVPVMVYAKSSDIGVNYDASNGKYNVLKNEGFRYFISAASTPYADVNVNFVRQSRIMVTGQMMTTNPEVFSNYFNAKDVLNDQRGS